MIETIFRVHCDTLHCHNSCDVRSRISEKNLLKMPQLVRKELKRALTQAGFGEREVGGRREHLCPECWAEEFRD